MIQADLNILLPEIVLSVYAILALLGAVYTGKDKMAGMLVWLTAGLMVALAFYLGTVTGEHEAFGGMFVDDSFARFAKILILLSAAAVLVMSQEYMARRQILKFEYPLLIALSTVGMSVMVSAGDLMSLYMGLELQSLSLYVVASLRRDSVKSTEAGLKYFVLGALSSGLLLYGASLVYGFTGTTNFAGIIAAADGQAPFGLLLGLVFVISGLAFKVSAVPFHMWTPDVYEGSPTPVTAFFATAPKVAAMALFARVAHDAFGGAVGDWTQIVAFLSVLSMVIGAVAAIGQRNIKRLMAYSSIGNMGFALVGLAAGNKEGVEGVLIYLMIYLVMTVGVFACILSMRRNEKMVVEIDDLKGLSQNNLPAAFMLALLMFSLAGIPPLAGFFAKFYVFMAAVKADMFILAVVGVLSSVVGAFYYLRIIKIMFFDEAKDAFNEMPSQLKVVLGLSGLFVLLYIVYPNPLIDSARLAAKALFPTA